MSYYSYTKTEKIIGCEMINKKTTGDFYVVMGFQRSGTSLLSKIVNSCGVSFGKNIDLKKAQVTNPDGFYEHRKINDLSWKYLKQSNYDSCEISNFDLHPKSNLNKIKRLFTVRKMHHVLFTLSKKNKKIGLKLFPLFYYLWKDFLPKHKIISIYRNPYSSVHSYLNVFWPSKLTFEHGLNLWIQSQKDLLYHTSQKDSLLISYEDLLDENKQDIIIVKIIDFIGSGDSINIKNIINEKLNRNDKQAQKIMSIYPEKQEIVDVLKKLEEIKFRV